MVGHSNSNAMVLVITTKYEAELDFNDKKYLCHHSPPPRKLRRPFKSASCEKTDGPRLESRGDQVRALGRGGFGARSLLLFWVFLGRLDLRFMRAPCFLI